MIVVINIVGSTWNAFFHVFTTINLLLPHPVFYKNLCIGTQQQEHCYDDLPTGNKLYSQTDSSVFNNLWNF